MIYDEDGQRKCNFPKRIASEQVAAGFKCPRCYKVWSSCLCEEELIAWLEEARRRKAERDRKDTVGAIR